mmetsp:Transcript_12407/g.16297  ORF Transcript_12407/g.16297 Transcript_12407/m.16297 type:complete len:185 (-) Transcript_12407:322-876(-)|eukprot:CAMPEP_0198145172 /NCGR_PEP_ID=MMETSP1443-20131203/21532_1 /TAXON_ID=186043 /ORGANISM="Entomoneis sp., Strain CCMP2396" /LENGTH=184 /DNA_ID=CAMNT_0043808729 /DNA_START=81 /DNA_END=635 /DNA_ORIENTATION=+
MNIKLASIFVLFGVASAFTSPRATVVGRSATSSSLFSSTADDFVELSVSLPPSGSGMQSNMRIKSCLPGPSEYLEVRYKLPFDLSVEPKNNLAICTKASRVAGGEQVGDVLRYTSQWTLGLPKGEGLGQSLGGFAGSLSWGCSMFDVMAVKDWRQVVEALTTNIPSRTDEVVLIFERPLKETAE